MKIGRILGNILITLIALFALFVAVFFPFGVRSQFEGWWIILMIGLPLACILLGLSWAMWARRRVRPVVSILIALGALTYTAFFAYATRAISQMVAKSTGLLAGMAYLALFPLWLLAFLFTVIAWALLRGQNLRGARSLFLGITAAWLAAWLMFWSVWLSRPEASRVLTFQAWPIHAFFLLPAILTLVFTLMLGKTGSRDDQPDG